MRSSKLRAIALLLLVGFCAANASCAGSEAVLSRHIVKASPSPSIGPSPTPSTSPSSPSPSPSPSASPSASPSPSPSTSPSSSPSPSPSPSPQLIGLNLFSGGGEQPANDPNYGQVLGYFSSNGTLNLQSQVITVPAAVDVTFQNFEPPGTLHTASFLGDATQHSAPWPPFFNGSFTQSPAGTIINAPMFSTGLLDGGTTSPHYVTPPPGFYMFGCGVHYDSNGMRTVIISQ